MDLVSVFTYLSIAVDNNFYLSKLLIRQFLKDDKEILIEKQNHNHFVRLRKM